MKNEKHEKIQKNLLLFLDGELPAKEMQATREHISRCSKCSRNLEALSRAWSRDNIEQPAVPLSLSWAEMIQRIEERKGKPRVFYLSRLSISRLATSAAFPFALFLAILSGVYVGTPSSTSLAASLTAARVQPSGTIEEFGLDQFNLLPAGSLAETLVGFEQ